MAVQPIDEISHQYQAIFGQIWDWGGFWVLDGPGDGTSICLDINNIKANSLVRYGGPGEGVKRGKIVKNNRKSHKIRVLVGLCASDCFENLTNEFPGLENP